MPVIIAGYASLLQTGLDLTRENLHEGCKLGGPDLGSEFGIIEMELSRDQSETCRSYFLLRSTVIIGPYEG